MAKRPPKFETIGPFHTIVIAGLLAGSLMLFLLGLDNAALDVRSSVAEPRQAIGRDFTAFWSGARLALAGMPEAVFDPSQMHEAEMSAIGGPLTRIDWHYPPTFLLAISPLALLPYSHALALWLVLSISWFCLVARQLFTDAMMPWLLLLFPAVTICVISGQNGILTACLIAAACADLDHRPVVAGFWLGLLTYKPHMAVLAFVALAAGGHWQALRAGVLTSAIFALASAAILGPAPWQAFFADLSGVAQLLESGVLPMPRMPTVFAQGSLSGLSVEIAKLAQALVTIAVVAVLCEIWHRRASLPLRGAALVVAIPLATPYAFDYDLACLSLAIAWLVELGRAEGWRKGDAAILAVAWVSPALSWFITVAGGPPLMPFVLMALLVAVWRRVAAPAIAEADSPRSAGLSPRMG